MNFDKQKVDDRLSYFIENNGENISNIEQQIIIIARLIFVKQKIIILDEVTNKLSESVEKKILEYLKTILKDKTVLFISHKPQTIKFCDRFIEIDKGKIIRNDSIENL